MKPNIVINVCFLGHSFTEMPFVLLVFKGQHQCNFKYQVTKGLSRFFPYYHSYIIYLLHDLEATENRKKKKGKNISLSKSIINIWMNSFPDLALNNRKEFQNNNFFFINNTSSFKTKQNKTPNRIF